MGGIWSGRYGRRSRRRRVEEMHELSVACLRPALMFPGNDTPTVATVWVGREDVRIRFESTPQHLGGVRWWLLCPRCGRRRAKLYSHPSTLAAYACRECHQLRYRSQCLSMPERWRHRANVYFRRAGCHTSDSFYHRPKWMRSTTFNELIDRAEAFENACFGYWLSQALRRKA
jgi:hypothetical protein